MHAFPDALHICAYDVRGTVATTGLPRPNRESGLVTRTHQLLRGLAERYPAMRITLTTTGAAVPGNAYRLRTPEGQLALVREIATTFPPYLRESGRKSPRRVQHYYEDTIDDSRNPIWRSLAGQYAEAIHVADTAHVLAMSINPLVSLLKADELALLDHRLPLTGVINDGGSEFARRFAYLAERISGGAEVSLIAVSEAVRQELIRAGVPADSVSKVLNGIDVDDFKARLRQAAAAGVWQRVQERNNVPAGRRVILVCARRVPWKGHMDVIWAARHLADRNLLDDTCVVFNGAGMLDTRYPGHQHDMGELIRALGLTGRVILLDELTPEEVISCYVGAHIAVLPSRKPEPFGYANIEAMLAGVPVVSTGQGGPLEYVEHGTSGLLVPSCSPDAIATALERLLTNDAVHGRIGKAGRCSAERFTLGAMLDGYQAAIIAPIPARGGSR